MVEMEGEPAEPRERRAKRGALKKAKKESKHTTGDGMGCESAARPDDLLSFEN